LAFSYFAIYAMAIQLLELLKTKNMEKIKLSMDTVLRLQYAIVAASVYPHFLKSHPIDHTAAAREADEAAIMLVQRINTDLDNIEIEDKE